MLEFRPSVPSTIGVNIVLFVVPSGNHQQHLIRMVPTTYVNSKNFVEFLKFYSRQNFRILWSHFVSTTSLCLSRRRFPLYLAYVLLVLFSCWFDMEKERPVTLYWNTNFCSEWCHLRPGHYHRNHFLLSSTKTKETQSR